MKVIDEQLGGTTPLDVILTFNTEEKASNKEEVFEKDEFDSFEDEYAQSENDAQ